MSTQETVHQPLHVLLACSLVRGICTTATADRRMALKPHFC